MYTCRKCQQTEMYMEIKGTNTGLYCSNCGSWYKWLNKSEIKNFKHSGKVKISKLENSDLNAEIDDVFEDDDSPFLLSKNSKNFEGNKVNESDEIHSTDQKDILNKSDETMITLKVPLRLVKEIMKCIEE